MFSFSRKKRFHLSKLHLYKIGKAQNMAVVAGRLVLYLKSNCQFSRRKSSVAPRKVPKSSRGHITFFYQNVRTFESFEWIGKFKTEAKLNFAKLTKEITKFSGNWEKSTLQLSWMRRHKVDLEDQRSSIMVIVINQYAKRDLISSYKRSSTHSSSGNCDHH